MPNTNVGLSTDVESLVLNFPEMKLKSTKIDKYQLFYVNEANFQEIYQEIFMEHAYDFETDKKDPLIIDCGSNIGMATIYFKIKYPDAKIICFEPDPIAYSVLRKNIETNDLKNIITINAAVAKSKGEVNFFGEFFGQQPNSLGNSILKGWGDRGYTDKINVKTVQLSEYVHEKVDFLKMDVEGAEIDVLEELGEKLQLVNKLFLEIHQVNNETGTDKLCEAKELLAKYKFLTTCVEKNIQDLLPPKQQDWVAQSAPKLFICNAQNTVLSNGG